jgi:hypothetical protein
VSLPYRGSKGPLNLLIDSTGIKAEGEGEWNARKHGGPKRRVWRKIHIGIDEETLEVRAVHCPAGDLLGKSAERGGHQQQHRRCSYATRVAEPNPSRSRHRKCHRRRAYDTRKCHEAIAARDAHAVIPPRKNAKPWKPPLVHAGMHCRAVDERRSNCP